MLRSSSLSTSASSDLLDTFSPPTIPRDFHPHPEVELCRRGEIRTEKFLQAATEVFLERGYRNARLSDIVARSGGSLATLYRVFGGKKGLALAIMRGSINSLGAGMVALLDPDIAPDEALHAATEHMIAETLTPQRIVVHRIVINQGLEFPELRDWFFEHGTAPMQQALRHYFEREHAAGRLAALVSPDVAAQQFLKMVFATVVLHSANGTLSSDDIPAVQQQARESVQIFLNGIRPR